MFEVSLGSVRTLSQKQQNKLRARKEAKQLAGKQPEALPNVSKKGQ